MSTLEYLMKSIFPTDAAGNGQAGNVTWLSMDKCEIQILETPFFIKYIYSYSEYSSISK